MRHTRYSDFLLGPSAFYFFFGIVFKVNYRGLFHLSICVCALRPTVNEAHAADGRNSFHYKVYYFPVNFLTNMAAEKRIGHLNCCTVC
jgi:hypothetical protein